MVNSLNCFIKIERRQHIGHTQNRRKIRTVAEGIAHIEVKLGSRLTRGRTASAVHAMSAFRLDFPPRRSLSLGRFIAFPLSA